MWRAAVLLPLYHRELAPVGKKIPPSHHDVDLAKQASPIESGVKPPHSISAVLLREVKNTLQRSWLITSSTSGVQAA